MPLNDSQADKVDMLLDAYGYWHVISLYELTWMLKEVLAKPEITVRQICVMIAGPEEEWCE